MAQINVVVLNGRTTREAEMKFLASGVAVTSVGIAHNKSRKQGTEWVNKPVFIDVSAFGKTAEFLNGVHKGTEIVVMGSMDMDQWEDRNTGAKRSRMYIIADKVQYMQTKAQREAADDGEPLPANEPAAAQSAGGNGAPDDIPFLLLIPAMLAALSSMAMC